MAARADVPRAPVRSGLGEIRGLTFFERLRRSAEYADRILKGDNPAELPRASAYKVRTHHQSETANMLGLEVPPALLVSADEVIE